MDTGGKDLKLVREEITKLLRAKSRSNPRVWARAEAIRYRNLCELEEAILALHRPASAAS